MGSEATITIKTPDNKTYEVSPKVARKDTPKDEKEAAADDEWDVKFSDGLDQGTLFDVIKAANYLDIQGLLDATCKAVARKIKGKKAEEIRKEFNIENDFTPDEEKAIQLENRWCMDIEQN